MRIFAQAHSARPPVHSLLPIHRDVLRDMAETGRPLIRWEGGYWTTEDRVAARRREWPAGFHLPDRFVSIGLVRELEEKGLLRRTNAHAEEWRDPRELTEFGRELGLTLAS